MNKRWNFFVAIALVIGLGLGIWRSNSSSMQAVASTTCSAGFIVNTSPNSTTAQPLFGPVSVNLSMTTGSIPAPVVKVIFIIDGANPLGRGVQQGTSTLTWSMTWLTQVTPNGMHNIHARVLFADGTDCTTAPIPAPTNNPTARQFVLTSSTQYWQGPTNVNFDFIAKTVVPTDTTSEMNITPFVVYEWSSTLGSIAPQNEIAKFASGPAAGIGNIKVIAKYGGVALEKLSAINVVSQESTVYPSYTGDNATNTTTATANAVSTNGTTSSGTIPATSGGDLELEACILAAISRERYELFVGGKERPSPQEFEKIRPCFARRNFVLPSNFTPLSPKSVAVQKVNDVLRVGGIANKKVQKENSETETQTLVFTGVAKANSSVLLYVFSEPLVMTTTTDNNGNWSYSLEDPLTAGSHEVYAVVDKGDGTYERSNPFSFVIGTAQASAENPNGYSLELTSIAATPDEKNGQTILYVGAVGGLIVLLIAGLLMIMRRKSANKKTVDQISETDSSKSSEGVLSEVPKNDELPNETTSIDEVSATPLDQASNNLDNTIGDETTSVEQPNTDTAPQDNSVATKPEDQQNKT